MEEMHGLMPALMTLIDDHIIDPRRDHAQLYPIGDIVAVVVLATLCGAEGYEDIADWAMANQDWLDEHLCLEHGVPPESCIRRVFGAIDFDDVDDLFTDVTTRLAQFEESQICIDGKSVRGSYRRTHENEQALMLLNAWGHERRLVLAQRVIEPGKNEITEAPALLDKLAVEDTTVTVDAVNCQIALTSQLRERRAHYVMPVKENQPNLLSELEELFRDQLAERPLASAQRPAQHKDRLVFVEDVDKGHGRIETRRLHCLQGSALKGLMRLREFRDAGTVIRLERTRELKHKVEHETRYFISSMSGKTEADARRLNSVIRNHWTVENQLHWVLDVSLGEDACRVNNRRAAANLAVVRRLALNLVRQEPTAGPRVSIRRRRWRANCDRRYLASILAPLRKSGESNR